MAIKDDAVQNSGFVQPGTAAPRVAVQQQPQNNGWSFSAMGSLGGISRAAASEVLVKADAVFQEALKKVTLTTDYEVFLRKVDNTKETALRLSSLVMVVRRTADSRLAYHTVVLEASGEAVPPRTITVMGQQINSDRFSADVYDTRYTQAVGAMIARDFPGYIAQEASGVVVPRSFNWEDKDAVRQLVNNTLLPCIADLESKHAGFVDINLGSWSKDSQLQAQVSFNETPKLDYVSLPVRTDVLVTLLSTTNERSDSSSLNNQERSYKISEAGGFIDLLWSPVEQQQNGYGVALQNGPNYKFAARFVMTSLENQMRMTIPSQLLALASVLTLGEGTNYSPAFAPRNVGIGGRVVDTRDIGAINIEANVMNEAGGYGTKIDTKANNFDQQSLGRLIQTAIRPGLTYSLDVSMLGSDSWYNDVFSAAAYGDTDAVDAIIKAANTLTNGAFDRHYLSKNNPVLQNEELVLLGYYTGQDGTRHDVRDIDYLAVMNLVGEKDNKAPQEWSDTFMRVDFPIEKRLDARKKIITNLIGTEVTFTQTARRVTYTAEFLTAFNMAQRDVGLSIKPINPALHGDYINNRGTANWVGQTTMGVGPSGIFNSGFNNPAVAGQSRQYTSRWS